jgi:hypothetical protein
MSFEEVELDHVGGLVEQALEIPQQPGPVVRGGGRRLLQGRDGVLPGQVQQAEHDAQSLGAAGLMHGLGPRARQRTEQAALIQEVIDPTFNPVAFAAMNVSRIGGELPRFGARVQGNLFAPGIVDADQPGFMTDPNLAAHVFGRHRVIGPPELDIPIAMHRARRFLEGGENHRRQRTQQGLLHFGKELAGLLARGAMEARVRHGALPLREKEVLRGQTFEAAPLDRIVLRILHPRLDLPFGVSRELHPMQTMQNSFSRSRIRSIRGAAGDLN